MYSKGTEDDAEDKGMAQKNVFFRLTVVHANEPVTNSLQLSISYR